MSLNLFGSKCRMTHVTSACNTSAVSQCVDSGRQWGWTMCSTWCASAMTSVLTLLFLADSRAPSMYEDGAEMSV